MKLQTHDSNFLVKICDDGFQNMFVYQPTRDTSEIKKTSVLIMFLTGSKIGCILLNLNHCILLSCIA